MPLEELEDLVARLNAHLDGMSSQEKEEEVVQLIMETGPRFIPGIRNIPLRLYEEGEVAPSEKSVDAEGRPINDLADEVIAVKGGKSGQAKRGKSYQSLPSTMSKLTEPKTDSERSVMPGGKATNKKKDQQVCTLRWAVVISLLNVPFLQLFTDSRQAQPKRHGGRTRARGRVA